MTGWPISDVEAVDFASPLDPSGAQISVERAREVVAAAGWSAIVEPGDGFGGYVRAALGAVESFELLMQGATTHAWLSRLDPAEHGIVDGLTDALARWRPRADPHIASRALVQGARWHQKLVLPGDDCWPDQLDDLGVNAPAALWVRGEPTRLSAATSSVAMVGSRAASEYGAHVTGELTERAVTEGIGVVSGGAFGIDAVAHKVALAAGGMTVCVLAGGLDRFYPAAHHELISRIATHGVVVAEVPSGVPPARWRFLMRNRVIAALTPATVVVEAGRRSGAINTAGHAAALGRGLGAVPGPITSGTSAGCHRLLRDYGADVVEGGDDLVRLVRGDDGGSTELDAVGPAETRVLDALSRKQPRSPDRVAQLSGLSHEQTLAALGILSLSGLVHSRSDGFVRATRPR